MKPHTIQIYCCGLDVWGCVGVCGDYIQSEIQPLILNSADAEDAIEESGHNRLLIEEETEPLLFQGRTVSFRRCQAPQI